MTEKYQPFNRTTNTRNATSIYYMISFFITNKTGIKVGSYKGGYIVSTSKGHTRKAVKNNRLGTVGIRGGGGS